MLVAEFSGTRPDVADAALPATDYERQLLDSLDAIEQIVRSIGRRYRLPVEELEDLASSVRVKLVENDYEVFRKFSGRSSLRTYLTVVITRHYLDGRIARWGRWRPCRQGVGAATSFPPAARAVHPGALVAPFAADEGQADGPVVLTMDVCDDLPAFADDAQPLRPFAFNRLAGT